MATAADTDTDEAFLKRFRTSDFQERARRALAADPLFAGLGEDALAAAASRAVDEVIHSEESVLKTLPLFSELTEPDLRRLSVESELILAQAGETLFEAGAPKDECLVLIHGELKVQRDEGPAVEQPGSAHGYTALISEGVWKATGVAGEECLLLGLSRSGFETALGSSLAVGALRALGRRIQGEHLENALREPVGSGPPELEVVAASVGAPAPRSPKVDAAETGADDLPEADYVSVPPTAERLGSIDLAALMRRVAAEDE